MFYTSVAFVFPSNVSTLTSWISTDLMFNSEFFFMIYPSNGSVKQQFTLNILPSNLNFGIFWVVDVSKFSLDITKSYGTYFLPC